MKLEDLNYVIYGNNKKGTIVLLHGWGQNIEMMDMLGHPFEEDYQIIILDLPGFGKSKEPNESWSAFDYADFIHEFLVSKKVDNPILIGHSVGGRISLCYASKYNVKKMVLLSAPFRPSQKKKINYKTKIFKIVKKFKLLKPLAEYLKNKWGSEDYKNASPINRGSLVKIINEDLTEHVKTIKCPVLLIYGSLDADVSINEAKLLEKLIPDAGLVEYPRAHHYAYLERLNQTIVILRNFIE